MSDPRPPAPSPSPSDDRSGSDATGATRLDEAGYDPFAAVYERFWGGLSVAPTMALLERHLLVPSPARPAHGPSARRVLDLCCGTGQLCAALLARGHDVIGIDASAAMLAHARRRAPEARLIHADAREFTLDEPVDVVVSAFDSLNHLPDEAALAAALGRAHRALVPGGGLLFDLNLRDGFEERFQGSFALVEEALVVAVRARFDGRHGHYDVTILEPAAGAAAATEGSDAVAPPDASEHLEPTGEAVRDGAAVDDRPWRRRDVHLWQRCFEVADVLEILGRAGFVDVAVMDAEADLGLEGHVGRAFFLARRGR